MARRRGRASCSSGRSGPPLRRRVQAERPRPLASPLVPADSARPTYSAHDPKSGPGQLSCRVTDRRGRRLGFFRHHEQPAHSEGGRLAVRMNDRPIHRFRRQLHRTDATHAERHRLLRPIRLGRLALRLQIRPHHSTRCNRDEVANLLDLVVWKLPAEPNLDLPRQERSTEIFRAAQRRDASTTEVSTSRRSGPLNNPSTSRREAP